jgi:hypothetical protein
MYKTLDEYLKEYPIDKDDEEQDKINKKFKGTALEGKINIIKTDWYGKELKKYPIINNNKK